MNMRGWLLTLVLLAAVCAACSKQPAKQPALTIDDVAAAFESEGVPLEPYAKPLHPDNAFFRELNGVKPRVFALNDKTTSIYVYNSEKARKAGEKDFPMPAATVVEHNVYTVKNVLIYYVNRRQNQEDVEARIQKAIERMGKMDKKPAAASVPKAEGNQ